MEEAWLREAKQLAVGQSRRYRCCGRTPAGVLYNKVDSWQMYCFRCHQSAREMKQYVSLVPQEVLPRDLAPPSDLQKLDALPEYMQTTLYGFLIQKGIWPDMAGDVYYTETHKRLVFKTGNGILLARALHEYQLPKWVVYGSYSEIKNGAYPKRTT